MEETKLVKQLREEIKRNAAETKRGIEIDDNLSGLATDLRKHPEIPVDVYRFLIRNVKPKQINTGVPVISILAVYTVKNDPLIVFTTKDGLTCIWHQDRILARSKNFLDDLLVGDDGTVVLRKFKGPRDSHLSRVNYYLLPGSGEPFFYTQNKPSLKNEYLDDFYNKHEENENWEEDKLSHSQCFYGSMEDRQICIISSGKRLYEFVLGYAEDFDNSGE